MSFGSTDSWHKTSRILAVRDKPANIPAFCGAVNDSVFGSALCEKDVGILRCK